MVTEILTAREGVNVENAVKKGRLKTMVNAALNYHSEVIFLILSFALCTIAIVFIVDSIEVRAVKVEEATIAVVFLGMGLFIAISVIWKPFFEEFHHLKEGFLTNKFLFSSNPVLLKYKAVIISERCSCGHFLRIGERIGEIGKEKRRAKYCNNCLTVVPMSSSFKKYLSERGGR